MITKIRLLFTYSTHYLLLQVYNLPMKCGTYRCSARGNSVVSAANPTKLLVMSTAIAMALPNSPRHRPNMQNVHAQAAYSR